MKNITLALDEETVEAGCGVVLSEDLNPGQVSLGVRVQNPFV
jgi:hypothetical protein